MFFLLFLFANNDSTTVDTVETFEIPEIISFQHGITVTGEIEPAFYEKTSIDVLSNLPFVIKSFGFNQQGAVSGKGLSPQYTRIYVDGRPQHVHPLGYVNQAQLPLHFFDRISYGNSPSGAELTAANFMTRVNKYDRPYSDARFSFGSFESNTYGMDLTRAVTNDLGFYVSGQYYKTGGYRENAEGEMMSVFSNVYYNRFLPMRIDVCYTNIEYGFPGSTQALLYGQERDQTFDIAGTVGVDNSAVMLFYDYQSIDYADTINEKSLMVRTDQFGALAARHDTLQGVVLDYGASGFLTALDGGGYLPTRLSKADIWAQGKMNSGRFFVQAGGLLGLGNYHETYFCPKVEFGMNIAGSLDLRAGFARDVRLPSDFEQWAQYDPLIPYFLADGNRLLESEYCLTGEIGLRGEGLLLNFYRLDFTDYIAVHIESGSDPVYVNVNSWEASGLEGYVSYPLQIYNSDSTAMTEFVFAGSFNALISGDSLLYVPLRSARAILSVRRNSGRFGFGLALRSEFSDVRHDIYGEDHAGFSVYSVAVLLKFISLSCMVRLNNIFDEDYAYIPYYPMAPRNYDVTVKWEFWD